MDRYKVGMLLSYLTELFDKSKILYNSTTDDPENPSPLATLYLAEIFVIKENAKLLLALNEEIGHHDITSVFSFFDRFYFELKSTIGKRDANTSWLYSEYENYIAQHGIAIQMIRDFLNQQP